MSSFDLVVVGGGFAGWTAARRAQDLGARVIVVEKSDVAPGWGNGRLSAGVLHAAYLDAKSPPADLYRYVMAQTDGNARPDLARTWAENCGRTVDWIVGQGIDLVRDGDDVYRTRVLAPPKPYQLGQVWQDQGPDRFLRTMWQAFVDRGGSYRGATRARELTAADGVVTGVVVESAGGAREALTASAVLLADGGFQANGELLERYLGIRQDQVKLRGVDTGTGDGLLMGLSLGAKAVNMGWFYGHCLCRDALTNDRLWPFPWLDTVVAASIVVTPLGERFADEGLSGIAMANAVAKSAAPLDSWAIFDRTVWEGPAKSGRLAPNPYLAEGGGTVLFAESLADLAAMAGIDGDRLAETVAAYNRRCLESVPVNPPRTGKPFPIRQAPFVAIPLVAGITFTMGGLLVNSHSQVLNQEERPIPGLYAAGGTMGGLEGGPRGGYAGGLLEAMVFGLLAAEHAVKGA